MKVMTLVTVQRTIITFAEHKDLVMLVEEGTAKEENCEKQPKIINSISQHQKISTSNHLQASQSTSIRISKQLLKALQQDIWQREIGQSKVEHRKVVITMH